METSDKNLSDYLAVGRRRWKRLVWTGIAIFMIAVVIAFAWPPKYVSTATILIEQQEVPQDLVQTTVTTYVNQQIQTISQRVMTSKNLTDIIKKYNLYAERRQTEPLEQVISDMRDDISLNTVSADVVDPRTGRPMPATIAFTLSYQSKSPSVAQKVANELVSLYLNENLKTRTEIATGTSSFLADEAGKLKKRVDELDHKIAAFKEKNLGKLPDMLNINMEMLDRNQRQINGIDSQLSSLLERKTYLEGQLAQISPKTKLFDEKGVRILGPADRLAQLKVQYAAAAAKYAPDHPDVISLKKQIEALQKEVNGDDANEQLRSDLQSRLQQLRSDLAEARKKYSPDHPDVKRLSRDIAIVEQQLASVPAKKLLKDASDADNPAYIQLSAELQSVNTEITSMHQRRADLDKKISKYEEDIAAAPLVERGYKELMRDYNAAQAKYQEITQKQMAAQVSEAMESQRKGERFTLIEPPQLPQEPAKPNRLAIVLVGLVFSTAGGVGSVAMAEAFDSAMYGGRGVAAVLGVPPLAVVPYIVTKEDVRKRILMRIAVVIGLLLLIAIVLALVHFFVIPLDVLWAMALQRLGYIQI